MENWNSSQSSINSNMPTQEIQQKSFWKIEPWSAQQIIPYGAQIGKDMSTHKKCAGCNQPTKLGWNRKELKYCSNKCRYIGVNSPKNLQKRNAAQKKAFLDTGKTGKTEIICLQCKQKFLKRKKGKVTAKFCTNKCGSLYMWNQPGMKEKFEEIRKKCKLPPVIQRCPECKRKFQFKKHTQPRTYCSGSCGSKARAAKVKNFGEKMKKLFKEKGHPRQGKKDLACAKRMRENNPMSNPITLEKMRQKMIGKTFLARGGNGELTVPQLKLAESTGLPVEWVIKPERAKISGLFKSLPTCYKVDLANPLLKIAIEVDGETHKRKLWRFLDHRKKEVLNHEEWSVLRFKNEEVMEKLTEITRLIKRYTISKSKRITTILQTEF